MPKITITLTDSALAQLDAICAKSGYTRSEQIEGMIAAEAAEDSPEEQCVRGNAGLCPTCGDPRCFGCTEED